MRIALVAALMLTSCFAYADEGQWQPYQMLSIADKLQQRGIDIPASQLADLGQYPMNAVVSLGYCTASFVSPQGLVVTNHHCAYRGIQYNSKKEHNYLANGFLAHTQAEEPSAGPNERLYITEEVTDVTEKVLANLSDEPLTRFEQIQTNSKALVKECEIDSNYRCEVDDFHHGLEYYLTKKLIIRDVRLVYAPPETVGGFGGDIDNYEYPRHSGDFTFLRAYVGKDGKPATFNKDNVPYQPKSYLKINADGVKAGDGIFVAGYPGSTSRYNLTSELQFASDWIYPTYAKRYQLQIDTINFMGAIDKDIALKYAGTMASMANRMKKFNGLLDGFNATDIVGIKQQRENDFLAWLKKDPTANQDLISNLEALLAEQHEQSQTNYFFKNAQSSEMLNTASKLYRLAKERKKPNDKREPGYQLRDMKMFKAALRRIDSSFDPAVDKTLWLQDLQAYVRQPLRNEVFDSALSITDNFEALEIKVEALYALTELTDQTKRLAWMKKTALDFETSEDPFIRLAVAIYDTNMALEKREKILDGKLSSARPEYMKAIIDYYKSNNWPVYPDANRTLRITYGMVDGYLSKDATYKQPFTRLEGLMAKHTGKEPYNVPAKLLAAIKSGDLGDHRVTSVYKQQSSCQFMSCLDKPADFNSVPVNFLSSADTTGGNSGSPVFNGRGELVGLNFDSTYEAITKDWFFNPTITRAVHVDIRYILWMMDKVDHADNLIKELALTRNSDIPDVTTTTTIIATEMITETPIEASLEAQTENTIEEPTGEPTENAIEALTEVAIDTSTEAAAKAPTEAAAKATTEAAAEATTEAAAEATTEAAAEATTKAAAEATTEAAAEATTKTVAEATTKTVAEATTKTVAEATTKTVAEATTKTVAEATTKTVAEATTKTVAEATTKTVAEATTKTVAEATTEAAAEATTEAAAEATTEAAAEATTEATTEAVTEAKTEVAAEAPKKVVTNKAVNVTSDTSSTTDISTEKITEELTTVETEISNEVTVESLTGNTTEATAQADKQKKADTEISTSNLKLKAKLKVEEDKVSNQAVNDAEEKQLSEVE
ncbi:hypothetical protein GCM10009410_07790 [Shewanella ulleungensis]|uniref:Dipeptidyl-peptidase n=1 Tax=Shewanella ulleungensis TaxID=2282699 RepID=A0ABQ2QEY5_9GAMM|nr:hypothetical protein GCM10009410_07790 [Shewanella ulleungensis]